MLSHLKTENPPNAKLWRIEREERILGGADNWWGGADKSWADERQNEGGTDLEKPGVGLNISVVSLDKSCFKTFTVNTVSFWIRKWLLNHSHRIVTL